MIHCACLLKINQLTNEILLVRVRDNVQWYLPGGKIEQNESAEDALIRELHEELNITINKASLKHYITIIDQALGIDDLVELNCFTGEYTGEIKPQAEISEVRLINWQANQQLLAPAVLTLCKNIFV